MTAEENKRRSLDANVNYIKENICDRTGDKSYVFISYKSDDWETVLHDCVYRLVKDYGLNIYFDGSFDSHNSLWINQFPENMSDYKCKGVIAFFDDKYATSYATLMELLYSQTKKAAAGKKDPDGLPVVPVDLAKLTNITGEQGQRDTGLGVGTYDDGSVNVNAESELNLFSKSFTELVNRGILKDAQYLWEPGDRLNAMTCSQIVRELKAYKKVNENHYSTGMPLDGIVGSIKNAFGPDVFSEIKPPVKPIVEPPVEPPQPLPIRPTETTTLNEFEKMCERKEFCVFLGETRNSIRRGGKGLFDYLMAALLRGCDADIFDKKNNKILKLSGYNYNKYAVSDNPDDPKTSDIPYPWTWTTACRKSIKKEDVPERFINDKGKIKSGKLEDFNAIFEVLSPDMKISEVLDKFKNKERGFDTKNNDLIFEAWDLIKNINLAEVKEGLDSLL